MEEGEKKREGGEEREEWVEKKEDMIGDERSECVESGVEGKGKDGISI